MPGTLKWHQSIERKLPVVFSLLLIVLVLGFGWFVSREVHMLAIEAAEQRLARVLRQLVTLVEEAARASLEEGEQAAAEPEVVALARRGPGQESSEPIAPGLAGRRGVLGRLAVASAQTELVAVVTPAGLPILAVAGPAARDDLDPAQEVSRLNPTPGRAAGDESSSPELDGPSPLRSDGHRVFYDLLAPIRDDGRTAGYLVQRRVVTRNTAVTMMIESLVGQGARFGYGNADGSLWTDLRTLRAPPPEGRMAEDLFRYERDGEGEWLGAASPIERTPWMLLVEQPIAAVSESSRRALWRLAGIAAALLVAVVAAAWLFSRQITSPLRSVTAAATAIAGGDYSRRVRADRHDELGILARAFNSMAAKVEASHEELEQQVAHRTAKLSETLDKLSAAQDEILRKEKLAVLGELSSGIGHELRNPLGVMHNAVYILKTKAGDLLSQATHYLEVLERQIQLSEKIIGDLLDVARVRAPERRPVELSELVQEQLLRADVPEEVAVEIDIPDDLPKAAVDPVQAGQVILNLLGNAVQAMDGKGTLAISVRPREEDHSVELRVADSGPGVPAESRNRIFEPLYTTKARGIGLGLSVSRSLARANSGDLELLDARAQGHGGAVFALTLPIVERKAPE